MAASGVDYLGGPVGVRYIGGKTYRYIVKKHGFLPIPHANYTLTTRVGALLEYQDTARGLARSSGSMGKNSPGIGRLRVESSWGVRFCSPSWASSVCFAPGEATWWWSPAVNSLVKVLWQPVQGHGHKVS